MRRTALRQSRRGGFTLLEMLLALTLLGLMVATLSGGLQLGRRVWETGRDYEAVHEVEESVAALADLLARVYPARVQKANEAPTTLFDGQAVACRFVSLSEGDAQWGGLLLTEIGVAPGRGGADLAVWTHVYRPSEKPDLPRDAMQMTLALRDVATFELRYFGSQALNQPPGWTSAWTALAHPPQLIELHVAARRSGKLIDASRTIALRQR